MKEEISAELNKETELLNLERIAKKRAAAMADLVKAGKHGKHHLNKQTIKADFSLILPLSFIKTENLFSEKNLFSVFP